MMTGVDISPRMVELARQEEAREPLGIRYEVESSAELRSFADNSFDAAVSTMALMDTPDFPGVARAGLSRAASGRRILLQRASSMLHETRFDLGER